MRKKKLTSFNLVFLSIHLENVITKGVSSGRPAKMVEIFFLLGMVKWWLLVIFLTTFALPHNCYHHWWVTLKHSHFTCRRWRNFYILAGCHCNRCFIFSCELFKKKWFVLESNSIGLSVYNIMIIKKKEFNE